MSIYDFFVGLKSSISNFPSVFALRSFSDQISSSASFSVSFLSARNAYDDGILDSPIRRGMNPGASGGNSRCIFF